MDGRRAENSFENKGTNEKLNRLKTEWSPPQPATHEAFSSSVAYPDILSSHRLFVNFLLVSNLSKFALDLYPSILC